MSFYILLYIFVIFWLISLWYILFRKYKDLSWYYFLIFSISGSIWTILYFISFFLFENKEVLLYISKSAYFFSIICIYSFVLFIIFFNQRNKQFYWIKNKLIHLWFLWLWILYIWTDLIIEDMFFHVNKNDYYESEGPAFIVHTILSILFIPLFLITSYKKHKEISYLNKLRLKYILFWAFLFIILILSFQLFIPLIYDVWLFEKEIALFFIPFILFGYYSIHRYNLSNIKLKIWEWFSYIMSLLLAVIVLKIVKKYSVALEPDFLQFWWINNNYWFLDITIGVIIFSICNITIKKFILKNSSLNSYNLFFFKLKQDLPKINNLDDLNDHINKSLIDNLWITFSKITVFKKSNELSLFLEQDTNSWIFFNDIVFIEENKHKFSYKKIKKYINPETYIIFPLYWSDHKVIWIFELWRKKFHEHYYSQEINILQDFVSFIEWHLKYVNISKKVHELSVNLDKQVDKQTFEYNQLINKQKEFISIISHEVKWPIASSIFQIDSIIEDFEEWNLQGKQLSKELHILNTLLLKTGDLVNKLFSIQQFEMNTKSLFLEQIKISELIHNEIKIFNRLEPNIEFITNINETIGYIALDKVQFRQVIDNLIWNAVKVVNRDTWKIYVSCKLVEQNMIKIVIEDNGKWFTDIEIKKIFEKYTTGWKSGIWLGMGLYLCKNIVEMHWWNIQADFWKKLWWARIIIKIPRT